MRSLCLGVVLALPLLFIRPAVAGCPPQAAEIVTASWYGPGHHGRPTASGEIFDSAALTAAHPCLPFGTLVDVQDVGSGRSVLVRINDRGPFVPGRQVDLSQAAAARLGLIGRGIGRVRLSRVDPVAICPPQRPCAPGVRAAAR